MARFSGKKVIEHKMRILIFSTVFVSIISHSKVETHCVGEKATVSGIKRGRFQTTTLRICS
jgi:hypothetical protein